MKLSIITAVYNGASTIQDTIESVLSQSYPSIEYIVVDGMSTDGTDKVIDSYRDRITKCVREKDHGIYNALNKGLRLATGDIVGLLHADDFLAHTGVLERIAGEFLQMPTAGGVYGDLCYVDSTDTAKTLRRWKSNDYDVARFWWGWMPPHPTVYFRRECYESHGLFREDFQIAADYELLVRMMVLGGVSMRYIPETLVKMRVGGKSNASLGNRLLANREDLRAWTVNRLRAPLGLRFTKPLRKLPQFF